MADVLDRREIGAGGEHRQPAGELSFRFGQQVPAPLDDRAQRALTGQRGAAARGEQPEPVVEALGDLPDRHRPQPRGRQLQCERHAVEPAADLPHVVHSGLVEPEARLHRVRPVQEQPHRAEPGHVGLPVRHRERPDGQQRLAVDRERFPAGREHPEVRHPAQQHVGELGRRAHQVLAVVQHQQRLAGPEHLRDPSHGVVRPPHRIAAERHVERADHGARHVLRRPHPGQRREPHAPLGVQVMPRRDLRGQPRLARTARPDQRHEPHLPEQPGHSRELVVAPDEAGEPHRQPVGHGPRTQFSAQCRQVNVLQFGRRVDAQLVGESAADLGVDVQGVRLPALRAQRLHEQPGRSFPQRVLPVHRGQRGHVQIVLVQVLLGGEACLVQPRHRGPRERRLPDVGQRLAPPQAECLRQPSGGAEPVEPEHVHVVARDRQPIAARLQRDGGADLAQPRHERLQRVRRVRGRLLTPQVVDERGRRNGTAGVEGEPGQEHANAGTTDVDRCAVRGLHGRRSQQCHPHPSSLPDQVRRYRP